jgi:putative MATE family efflux protein
MGEDSITKLLIRFSLPATLAMVVNASYNIVDTIFVGRLGSKAIAALSVSFPIQMLLGALAIGTGVGAGSLISRSLGAGKHNDATIAAGQVFLLDVVLGIIAALVGIFYLRPLLIVFGATPDILEPTMEYMSYIFGGGILLFLIMTLNHVTRAEGNPMLPMIVMIVSAVTNIILDPIFIFGLGMGIRGAAIATLLAKMVGVLMLLWYYLTGKSTLNLRIGHLYPDWRIITDIYRVGLPTLLIQVSVNFALVFVNRVLGTYGYIPIAVMGLIMRMQMFALMPIFGISQGLIPIIGYNFGAGKYSRIREAMFKGWAAGTVFVTVTGVSFFLFPGFFLGIFSSEPELLQLGVSAVRIIVFMYPLLAVQTMSIIFFQAIGKGVASLWLSLLRQFILYIPLVVLMPRFFGLTGIWFATPLADLLAFIVTVYIVSKEFAYRGIPLWSREKTADETVAACSQNSV